MNLLLLAPEELHPEPLPDGRRRAEVTGRRLDHLLEVLKLDRRGGGCRVGVLDGPVGRGELLELDRTARRGVLAAEFDAEPPPPLPLTLLAALPRPKSFRKVLHAAVSMGVKRLWFFHSFKVEKSYWQSPLIAEPAWREEAMLALEQAVDTRMPEVVFRRRFKPFVEDELPALAAGTRLLAAHPGAAAACPSGVREPVTLCVGPEGGFTDYEIALLAAHGAQCVSLGARILRTEVAVPVLLARLSAPEGT